MIKFCKDRDIIITAYCPLGRPIPAEKKPNFLYDAKLLEIGKKYGKTVAQIVMRYLVSCLTKHQHNNDSNVFGDFINKMCMFQVDIGTVPIPKSVTPKRIDENIEIFDFKLTDDEIKYIDTFNTGERVIHYIEASKHKHFPFGIEF